LTEHGLTSRHQHSIGYMGDSFLQVKRSNQVSKYWRNTQSTQ